jgi:ubiquinone biosynthesis protein UbiJ
MEKNETLWHYIEHQLAQFITDTEKVAQSEKNIEALEEQIAHWKMKIEELKK